MVALDAGADGLPINPAVKVMVDGLTGLQLERAAAAGDVHAMFRAVHAIDLARLEEPAPQPRSRSLGGASRVNADSW